MATVQVERGIYISGYFSPIILNSARAGFADYGCGNGFLGKHLWQMRASGVEARGKVVGAGAVVAYNRVDGS